MNRTKRNDKQRDKKGRIEKDKILILCGGETEELYFKNFRARYADVKVETDVEAVTPLQLAISGVKKFNTDQFLRVYCVFDKDDFNDFDRAIDLLKSNRDVIAIFSNQAFELWFIYHLCNFSGCYQRDNYKAKLNNLLGRNKKNELDKPYENMYELLKDKTGDAINNAKIIYQTHNRDKENEPISNWESCTNVYILVDYLIKNCM